MRPDRRKAGIFLLWLCAAWAGFSPASDAAPKRLGCSRAESCPAPYHRSIARSASSRLKARKTGSRYPWYRRKLYRGNETAIRQLSPRLRARRISSLRFRAIEDCDPSNGEQGRPACVDERNLAEALIRPPSRSTRRILRETGIPTFQGVPPIFYLHPQEKERD